MLCAVGLGLCSCEVMCKTWGCPDRCPDRCPPFPASGEEEEGRKRRMKGGRRRWRIEERKG